MKVEDIINKFNLKVINTDGDLLISKEQLQSILDKISVKIVKVVTVKDRKN